MGNRLLLTSLASLVLTIVTGCAHNAQQETGNPWVASYTADLANTKTADNDWSNQSGDIKVDGGKLLLTPQKGHVDDFLYDHRFPKSVRVEFAVTPTTTVNPPNINFDLHINTDVPVGTSADRGYVFQFRTLNPTCSLRRGEKFVEGTKSSTIIWESGKTYNVIAEQYAGQVSLTVDGVQVFSIRDEKPLESPTLDMVGFSAHGCALSIGKFVVSHRTDEPASYVAPMDVPEGPQITVIGTANCARACTDKPGEVDHNLVIYALDGSPQVKAEVNSVLDKFYPEKGLDCDAAEALLKQFDQRLMYYIVPGPLVNPIHSQVEYGSQTLSVTGTFFRRDGKNWIAPTKIEKAGHAFPAKMLAPDVPFIMPDKQPLILKVTDSLSLKCIKIPAGRFVCGSPLYEDPRWQDEYPHEVTLTRPYYMAEIPVTQEMFEAVTGKNPSVHKGPQFAVEGAHWADIDVFLKTLSEKNGRKVRLMTDAEWEWAARVGTSSPCFGEKYLDQRSFVGDREGHDEAVKLHKPNAWGIYDMVKSGWELVSDYKMDSMREKITDPPGPTREQAADHGDGPLRRSKGGSYYGDLHLNMHGAANKDGGNEEGIVIFRVVAEETPAP